MWHSLSAVVEVGKTQMKHDVGNAQLCPEVNEGHVGEQTFELNLEEILSFCWIM